jgi:hypothetical protein
MDQDFLDRGARVPHVVVLMMTNTYLEFCISIFQEPQMVLLQLSQKYLNMQYRIPREGSQSIMEGTSVLLALLDYTHTICILLKTAILSPLLLNMGTVAVNQGT